MRMQHCMQMPNNAKHVRTGKVSKRQNKASTANAQYVCGLAFGAWRTCTNSKLTMATSRWVGRSTVRLCAEDSRWATFLPAMSPKKPKPSSDCVLFFF